MNVLYFNVSAGAVFGQADYDALATDLLGIYMGTIQGFLANGSVEVKLYDMGDALPRQAKSVKKAAGLDTESGPREVALCLSFFADTNVPTRRGRVYFGPFDGGQTGTGRPSTNLRNALIDVGQLFSGLGGANVDWSQYSQKLARAVRISDLWVDDEWDTQRRRGVQSTTRARATING